MKKEIRMSPITRLYATFDLELNIDKSGILDKLREKYQARLEVASEKRDTMFRSLFVVDAALAILVSGSSLKIPMTDLTTSDLPAILELTTAASAIVMVFCAVAFVNWAAYTAIVNQYAVRESQSSSIDPDFIDAAQTHTDLTLKILRKKFNIWGADFHEPGRGFKLYSITISIMIGALFLLFPALHYILTWLSFSITMRADGFNVAHYIYFLIVLLGNLLAILIFVGSYRDFKFFVDNPRDREAEASR